MTRVIVLQAGPTPWDVEDRIVGNHPLPLTDLARATIEGIAASLKEPVTAVYRHAKNEACDQAAKIVAAPFKLRPHDSAALDEMNLGLWQGLTRSELRFRQPTVVSEWDENPLGVKPPDGETLEEAIARIGGVLKRILRRNRGGTIVLCLRPIAMQITLGLLRREDPQAIASHLHNTAAVETIELADEAV